MFAAFFKPRAQELTGQQLYGTVMAQSREPWFFQKLNVPDTVMGRFDMLALHVYMLARRLARETDQASRELNQQVFDIFVADLDRALRELGIGDTSVPKRKKKMVRSFYGQIAEFDECLDEKNTKLLEERVARRYFADSACGDATALTNYMVECEQKLKQQELSDFKAGVFLWPSVSE